MVFAEGFNTPYELSAAGEGKAGYYLVEVSAYVTKKKDINIELTKQCAIHGVLFKGYSGNNGNASKPPIIEDKNIEKEKSEFFKTLIFNKYGYYTTVANDFKKVIKVGKRYKITTIVQVNAAQLRKDLEKENIIRSLGF
jgi:hypothetical protein